MKTLQYGIGRDYLPKWNLLHALREIYQNYIDYGDYDESVEHIEGTDEVIVTITNSYKPESLEFLKIGHSEKGDNKEAIGAHGEGLKMAFLIMLRYNLPITIYTPNYTIRPCFTKNRQIGDILTIRYWEHNEEDKLFTTVFHCPTELYGKFSRSIVQKEEVVYSDDYHGDIVDRPKGHIYSGRLYVCTLNNLSKAYNIKPSNLKLDRDRRIPPTWDISYHASKINQGHAKWTTKDTYYSDTMYIDEVPEEVKVQYKPKMIGNSIEFITKDEEGNTHVLKNDSIKTSLLKDSYFKPLLDRVKRFIARKLGLYELLLEFKEKHIRNSEAMKDFDIILERVKA